MMYLLDTNICIYAIKHRPEAVLDQIHAHMEDGLCISSVTLAELRHGIEKSAAPEKNEAALLRFLAILTVLPFDDYVAIEYGKIRAHLEAQGMPIGPMDLLIAAHAKAEGATLVTNNVREFSRVPGLRIENWAEKL